MNEQEKKAYLLKVGNRIKDLRLQRKMSQDELAKACGYGSRSTINKIELGINDVPQSKIKALADALHTTVGSILGIDDGTELPPYDNIYPIELKKFPLLGEIACGEPIYAEEDRESYVMAGANIRADFCLKAKGDSMTGARIMDGDIVFIRKQDMVEDGEIAAVVIDDEATLKRVYYDRENNMISLVAENPAYKPLVYTGSRLNEIHILGKAVAFQSDVR